MIKKIKKSYLTVLLLINCVAFTTVNAQFTLSGQLRTRTEVRNGLGNLVLRGSKPAAFTSQRTRLAFGYKWDRLTFGVTIQDVRVWGQDASTISNADGNRLMLHEGWAELTLFNIADTTIRAKGIDLMSLKIGRQELSYDDVRLIGNLDWLQQGRRHDMALLKTVHKGWQIDIGYAFNQNTDAFGVTNTSYVPSNVPAYVKNSLGVLVPTPAGILPMAPAGNAGNNSTKTGAPVWINPPTTNGGNQDYKSFTSLYISKKFNQTKFSALFFNDNFGKYKMDSVGSDAAGYVFGKRFVSAGASDPFDYTGTHHRYTYGLMINKTMGNASGFGKIAIQAAYYAQSGKNRDGVKMKKAYHYTASVTYQKGKISFTPGYDVLSGNDATTTQDEKFDPLYGTPHRHWGYMDYFYVGTGSPAGGLKNPYLKFKYTGNTLAAGVDFHLFSIDKEMKKADGSSIDKKLGNELDFTLNYNMNKFTNIELGYSIMNAKNSMVFAKGQATTDAGTEAYRKTGNWFYAMVRFTPDFFFTKPVAIKQ
ncbi:MAG TPA: alginate export family protein [Chitinophagaceae bacterium]|nr:alginate export family protein [Chitinophagaceae bacterium]